MLTIECRLSPQNESKTDSSNLAVVDEYILHYDLFLGDVAFKGDGGDFSTNWSWVPVVDFMACMNAITQDLLNDKPEAQFEFTESDATLTFRLEGPMLYIVSDYADGQVVVPLSEFAKAVEQETKRLRNELSRLYPELVKNPHFHKLLGPGVK